MCVHDRTRLEPHTGAAQAAHAHAAAAAHAPAPSRTGRPRSATSATPRSSTVAWRWPPSSASSWAPTGSTSRERCLALPPTPPHLFLFPTPPAPPHTARRAAAPSILQHVHPHIIHTWQVGHHPLGHHLRVHRLHRLTRRSVGRCDCRGHLRTLIDFRRRFVSRRG